MAAVSSEPGGNAPGSRPDDRGQILLIAAFTLAVVFVALALVVNSAIYTENLASRGEVTGSSEALHLLHQANQSVADAVEHANVHAPGSPETAPDLVRASVSDIGEQGGIQQIRGGQIVNVSLASTPSASAVRINDTAPGGSTFENASGPGGPTDTWRLASDVSRTRNVQLEVADRSSLPRSSPPSPPGNAVTIRANETGDTSTAWEVELWVDDSTNEMVANVTTSSGDTATCRTDEATNVEVDVTGGVLGGEWCPALAGSVPDGNPTHWGVALSSPYQIWIENGDQIEGNYSMIVAGDPEGSNLRSSPSSSDPSHADAIYDVEITYVFQSQNVEFVARTAVARGEPPA